MAGKKSGAKVRKLIRDSGEALKEIMREHLYEIADAMIEQVRVRLENDPPSQHVNAFNGVEPKGTRGYESEILTALAVISLESIDQARKEVPKAKNVKLTEKLESLTLSEFDKLPPGVQKQLKNKAKFLVGTQMSDLSKNLFFQFDSSFDSTDSIDQILDDLYKASDDYIEGVAISSGSSTLAGKIVNEARNAFFFDDDVLEEIGAFEFYNGDPVSDICQDLAGTVFDKEDPNSFRYTPPLHFNCKSTILPLMPDDPRVDDIESLKPSSKKLEDEIQFSEKTILT